MAHPDVFQSITLMQQAQAALDARASRETLTLARNDAVAVEGVEACRSLF